jgi:hypothetical protein
MWDEATAKNLKPLLGGVTYGHSPVPGSRIGLNQIEEQNQRGFAAQNAHNPASIDTAKAIKIHLVQNQPEKTQPSLMGASQPSASPRTGMINDSEHSPKEGAREERVLLPDTVEGSKNQIFN